MRPRRIKRDEGKFIEILKGKIREDLKRYIQPGSVVLPAKGRKEPIKIRFYNLPLPRIRYGSNFGGIGGGKGEPGEDLGPVTGDPKEKGGEKKAGEEPGELIEVEFHEEEIMAMMDLELPSMKPKGEKTIDAEEQRWTSARKTGPESLIIKRGPRGLYKKALQRQLAGGEYDSKNPRIIPTKDDKSYRSPKPTPIPQNNALLVFMRDISGSVSDEEREIISYFCFFTEGLLARQYDELECVYIVHHVEAEEMKNQEEFLTRDSYGGTKISSAHRLLLNIVHERYPVEDWNIYPIYFSDGMNWEDDNAETLKLIKERILPFSNQYSYGEVKPAWRSWYTGTTSDGFSEPGYFGRYLEQEFRYDGRVVYLGVKQKEDAWLALEKFFGKRNT